MKILTVCQRGNNRSAALAFILRDERGPNEVINYGPLGGVSESTIDMLCEWAEKIIVTTTEVDVPEKFRIRRVFLDVGPDIWGVRFAPELLDKLRRLLDENSHS